MFKISKKVLNVIVSLITISTILVTINTSVLADVSLKIATTTTRIATTPNNTDGTICTNIGGLSVASTDTRKRMYVIKSHSDENEAILYFYANYDNIADNMNNENNTNYGIIYLHNLIGHANGMAIDDDYIYITC